MKSVVFSLLFLGTFLVIGSRGSLTAERSPLTPEDTTRADTLSRVLILEKTDIPSSASPALLTDRLNCIQKTIPLSYNSRVHAFVDYFTIQDREYTRMILRRIDRYFPLFEKYLKHYNLPDELKYLAIVESGLNPKAVSRAGASGLWQFMPSTGREFGLSSGRCIDERKDPEKSTKAACRYLAQLYVLFRDWELVLVAYNLGLGNVRKAIKKAGYRRSINAIHRYLPRETRSYLSQFVAIDYTLNYLKEHNLFVAEKAPPLSCDTLVVKDFLHLATFAHLVQVDVDSLRYLNPSILCETLPKNGDRHIINVPAGVKKRLEEDRNIILDSASRMGEREIGKSASSP